jgi:hypothetical protein
MAWLNVPICDFCWDVEEPTRVPVRFTISELRRETCYRCGEPTMSGIYVRRNV